MILMGLIITLSISDEKIGRINLNGSEKPETLTSYYFICEMKYVRSVM